jgi:adenylate cyclase
VNSQGRILVVDDTVANCRLLTAVLAAKGYEVFSATSGAEALELVASKHPDLILLDIYMPEMDGYEVCQRLREDPATSFLPIVMVTSAGNQERIPSLEAGADDFVAKPFDTPELLARVGSLLRIKAYHDTVQSQAAELSDWNQALEARVAEQVAELERTSRLRRFFSPSVADLIESSGDEAMLETHRREIAVLFCDLRGFTAFTRGAEPEDVATVLAQFHAVVGDLVVRHQATVGYFSGDGLMVYFNDPVPCPDPAARAVQMAVELRAAMGEPQAKWRAVGHDVGLGVGVGLGYATLGTVGFEGCLGYGAVGSVVNLASRLCDEAEPGEILVSASVHAAIGDLVATESIGELSMKGFPTPAPAWRVLGGEGDEAPAPRASTTVGATPAGRQPEAPAAVAPTQLAGNRFLSEGDNWTIAYDGTSVRLRDAKGLQYLARLLGDPGREFHVADLLVAAAGEATPAAASELGAAGRTGVDLVSALGDAGEVLDARAKAEYRRRLEDLRAEREEAAANGDAARAARAEEEIDFISQELAAAYGLGGRARKDADSGERLRKAVSNRIRDSITKLQRVHPVLGRHLDNAVRTGVFCSYVPEKPVSWEVSEG